MSKSLLSLLCAILITGGVVTLAPGLHAADPAPATTQPAQKPVNTKCPVTGEDVDAKITTVYEGKTIGFCCEDCVKSFKKNPEKYTANIK